MALEITVNRETYALLDKSFDQYGLSRCQRLFSRDTALKIVQLSYIIAVVGGAFYAMHAAGWLGERAFKDVLISYSGLALVGLVVFGLYKLVQQKKQKETAELQYVLIETTYRLPRDDQSSARDCYRIANQRIHHAIASGQDADINEAEKAIGFAQAAYMRMRDSKETRPENLRRVGELRPFITAACRRDPCTSERLAELRAVIVSNICST